MVELVKPRVIFQQKILRRHLIAQPSWTFVFGDNLERRGFGGQAKEMRGSKNAVGIPTKRRPEMDPTAFFQDYDAHEVLPIMGKEFGKLAARLLDGGTIVIPADGIGTGRAKLEEKAPKIYNYLIYQFAILKEMVVDLGGEVENRC